MPVGRIRYRRSISMEDYRAVSYTVFCIGVPIPVTCDSMAAAITTACKLMNDGAGVSQIKGSDGFVMDRQDIEIECARRHALSCGSGASKSR
jgi:hypothetical protein